MPGRAAGAPDPFVEIQQQLQRSVLVSGIMRWGLPARLLRSSYPPVRSRLPTVSCIALLVAVYCQKQIVSLMRQLLCLHAKHTIVFSPLLIITRSVHGPCKFEWDLEILVPVCPPGACPLRRRAVGAKPLGCG